MNLRRSCVMAGLNTETYTVEVAGVIKLSVRATEIPPSGAIITISQTGSTSSSFATSAPIAIQSQINIENLFNCAVGDVLSVVVSSSNTIDTSYSQIKSTITLKQGA